MYKAYFHLARGLSLHIDGHDTIGVFVVKGIIEGDESCIKHPKDTPLGIRKSSTNIIGGTAVQQCKYAAAHHCAKPQRGSGRNFPNNVLDLDADSRVLAMHAEPQSILVLVS